MSWNGYWVTLFSFLFHKWYLSFRPFQTRFEKVAPFFPKLTVKAVPMHCRCLCVNPLQAMVSHVCLCMHLLQREGLLWLIVLLGVVTAKFLNKKIWSSLNVGGQISVFHLWQPVSNSRRTAKFVFWNLGEVTGTLQLIFFFKLHTNLKH